jgi:hypothetical protein
MSYEDYYAEQLKDGQEFEDFAREKLYEYGLSVVPNRSRYRQFENGESTAGVEFKLQKRLAETGNLWIELKEKHQPRPGECAASGILRNDNSWLWVTGDYHSLWLLTRRVLIYVAPFYELLPNGMNTSIGYLLPARRADQLAEVKIYETPSQEWSQRIAHRNSYTNLLARLERDRQRGQGNLWKWEDLKNGD